MAERQPDLLHPRLKPDQHSQEDEHSDGEGDFDVEVVVLAEPSDYDRPKSSRWIRKKAPAGWGGGCEFYLLSNGKEVIVEKRYNTTRAEDVLAAQREKEVVALLQGQMPSSIIRYFDYTELVPPRSTASRPDTDSSTEVDAEVIKFFIEYAPGGSLDAWVQVREAFGLRRCSRSRCLNPNFRHVVDTLSQTAPAARTPLHPNLCHGV